MFKKYILSLAILGLAAPHAAMGGLNMQQVTKTAIGYAGHALKKLDQHRFWVGLGAICCFQGLRDRAMLNAKQFLQQQETTNIPQYINKFVLVCDIYNLLFTPGIRNKVPYGILGMFSGAIIYPYAKAAYNSVSSWIKRLKNR